MPFPIRALQVDSGSEFAAEFELSAARLALVRASPTFSQALSRCCASQEGLTLFVYSTAVFISSVSLLFS